MKYLGWEYYFELAKAYYEQYGNLEVSQKYNAKIDDEVVNLGKWIDKQRQLYKNGNLSEDRMRLLESIGMKWTPRLSVWEYYFKLATDYYNKKGNLKIPSRFTIKLENSENVINLGMWIHNQRQFYKNGKLSAERVKLLEGIGMVWNVSISEWEDYYRLACAYYEQYGHSNIPQEYFVMAGDDKINLGKWLSTQRNEYKKGRLTANKIKLLENIGIKWSINPFLWEEKFEIAKAYFQHYGNLEVPRIFSTKNGYDFDLGDDSIRLGKWINTQRTKYKNGELSEERIKLLESIGMKWSLQSLAWEKYFNLAKLYYEQNGNLNVPQNYVIKNENDNINLGIWISIQRKTYKKGQLSNERKEMLESIGMVWELRKRKPKDDGKSLCDEYNLDYEKNPDLLKIPFDVLSAKINYLNSNNIPLMTNNELNPIFFMSDVNMQVMYGISLEELVKQYSNSNKKGGK